MKIGALIGAVNLNSRNIMYSLLLCGFLCLLIGFGAVVIRDCHKPHAFGCALFYKLQRRIGSVIAVVAVHV